MFLKCGYLSAREILRMIRTNRTTNYPALGKKCRIVDVESRDAVYRSTTVIDIGPCAPKTRACSISAVFDGPDMKHPYSKSSNSGRARASCIVSTSASRGMRIIRSRGLGDVYKRQEDHQGRGTEIEGFVADVLPDPYRAVFRHTETTVDYAQVDIDQLPGVVHRVGVDSGVCFGQDGGDGFGVGIVSADQLCKGVPVCRDDLPAGRDIQFCDLQSDAGSGPEDDDSIRGDNR